MGFGITEAKHWLEICHTKFQAQKQYLTELDQAIGDGDHGLNIVRGFSEVIDKVTNKAYPDLAGLFKDVGMTLLAKVGGASGPLYGTIFLKAANPLNGKTLAGVHDLTSALSESLAGIQARGKAQLNDKTMVDVWLPAVTYLQEKGEKVEWQEFTDICKTKMEETKLLEAKKGRAAYLGKRSIGHIDPGAASTFILLSSLAEVLNKKGGSQE